MTERLADPYTQLGAMLWFLSETRLHQLLAIAQTLVLADFRKELAQTPTTQERRSEPPCPTQNPAPNLDRGSTDN